MLEIELLPEGKRPRWKDHEIRAFREAGWDSVEQKTACSHPVSCYGCCRPYGHEGIHVVAGMEVIYAIAIETED